MTEILYGLEAAVTLLEPLDGMPIPPKTFGEGWLTKNAADLCKIAIAFGGFEAGEIVLAVTKIQGKRKALANTATVEKALQMIYEAHETPEDRAKRDAALVALKARINGQAS
jgi:hypothetical protein